MNFFLNGKRKNQQQQHRRQWLNMKRFFFLVENTQNNFAINIHETKINQTITHTQTHTCYKCVELAISSNEKKTIIMATTKRTKV